MPLQQVLNLAFAVCKSHELFEIQLLTPLLFSSDNSNTCHHQYILISKTVDKAHLQTGNRGWWTI